jgi:NADH:ubiquinone reductase (H+-translocating)
MSGPQVKGRKMALLTSIVIGGGPTGVEMAGAISKLGRSMVSRDFGNLQPGHLKVLLVEAGPRILAAFPEDLSAYARRSLEKIGVDVRTESPVADITAHGAYINGEFVRAESIVWGAGVKASPAHEWLGIAGAAGDRTPVDGLLQVQGFRDIYALGDTAALQGSDGRLLPGLARLLGSNENSSVNTSDVVHFRPPPPSSFATAATPRSLGRNAAVFDFGHWMTGRLAWLLWAIVHVYLLINAEKRLLVSVQWIARYLTRQRASRIIEGTTCTTSISMTFPNQQGEQQWTRDRHAS